MKVLILGEKLTSWKYFTQKESNEYEEFIETLACAIDDIIRQSDIELYLEKTNTELNLLIKEITAGLSEHYGKNINIFEIPYSEERADIELLIYTSSKILKSRNEKNKKFKIETEQITLE